MVGPFKVTRKTMKERLDSLVQPTGSQSPSDTQSQCELVVAKRLIREIFEEFSNMIKYDYMIAEPVIMIT